MNPSPGLAIPRFDSVRHAYTHNNRRYPSVTEILRSEKFYDDYRFVDSSYRLRGRAVHMACLDLLKGVYSPEDYHEEIHPYIKAWDKYVAQIGYSPDLDLCERPVVDLALGVAGTPDFVGTSRIVSGKVLIDVKSGQPVKMVGLQLAAYSRMIEGVSCIRIASCREVNLQSSGSFYATAYDEPEWRPRWIAVANVYNLRKEFGLFV